MDFAWSDQKKGEGTENKIVTNERCYQLEIAVRMGGLLDGQLKKDNLNATFETFPPTIAGISHH